MRVGLFFRVSNRDIQEKLNYWKQWPEAETAGEVERKAKRRCMGDREERRFLHYLKVKKGRARARLDGTEESANKVAHNSSRGGEAANGVTKVGPGASDGLVEVRSCSGSNKVAYESADNSSGLDEAANGVSKIGRSSGDRRVKVGQIATLRRERRCKVRAVAQTRRE